MFLNDATLLFSSGISAFGRKKITATLCNGLDAGTSFITRNLISGGNVTIVDLVFINPSDSPNHCPPSGSIVFFHKEERISRVHLHYSILKYPTAFFPD